MSTHRNIDRICVAAVVIALIICILFMNGKALGISASARGLGYEDRLFDTSVVHTINIEIDDWDGFLDTCESEEYSMCAVTVDGESYPAVGIRGKGNTSLKNVASMNSDRYSFKLEFDQYDSSMSYYGLDKLCLNNIIQDNTYMKDYLAYTLMGRFGVDAPLCSFVYITVNGEEWGLYLAVEGVEDSFLMRNYSGQGELYKPDSMSFGGGRGNGKDFQMDDFMEKFENGEFEFNGEKGDFSPPAEMGQPLKMPDRDNQPSGMGQPPEMPDMGGEGAQPPEMGRGGGGGGFNGGMDMGSSEDVKLQYIDDDPESYSNIFSSAKTDVSDADKTRLIESLKSLSEYENLEKTLDIDKVLRYFAVHSFLVNGDSYTGSMIHNYYLHEQDGKLSMIPWDYNLAYGTFMGGNASSAINDPIDDVLDDRPMQAWIFSDEKYTELYHELYAEFIANTDFETLIDETYALIAPYVEKDPTSFCTFEEFENGVEVLKSYCALRSESVSGQLDGTIPSTSEAQQSDSSALTDASGLTLSDMGSMGGTGGGGSDMGGSFGKPDNMGEIPSGFGEMPDMGEIPGRTGFDMPGAEVAYEPSATDYAVIGASAAALIAGIIFALKFRRRREKSTIQGEIV